jgi:DNA-dependent RNA polymerase auxiliary subunit epsilon
MHGRPNQGDTAHAQRVATRVECREQLQSLLLRAPESAQARRLVGQVEMNDGNLQKVRALFDTGPAQRQIHE